MVLQECAECEGKIYERADKCPHCGNQLNWDYTDYAMVIEKLHQGESLKLKGGLFRRLFWFLIANAAVILSVVVLSGGVLLGFIPFVLILSCLFPFILLLFSKWLVKRVHRVKVIDPTQFASSQEESLYRLVKALSEKAGFNKVPEVGIYPSKDMNAFATGRSKKSSLVAFSSALLDKVDDAGTAAVAAHEIAHISNGDMVTMALVQSVVNSIVYVITLPLSVLQVIAFFSENVSDLFRILLRLVRFILTVILLFLGSLVVKAFSRKREFAADRLAARLVDKESMIHALEVLAGDTAVIPKEQKVYAAFKISSPKRWLDIFSTHPSIERRINALSKLAV